MFVTSDRCRRHDVKHRIDRVEFVPKLRYFLPGCIPLPVKRSPYCSASTRAVRMSRLGEVSHTYEGSSSPETIRRIHGTRMRSKSWLASRGMRLSHMIPKCLQRHFGGLK